MIFKKYILSALLLAAPATNYAYHGIPYFDSIEIVATLPHRLLSAATSPTLSRPLTIVEKIDIGYKIITAVNVLYILSSIAKSFIFPGAKEKLQFLMQEKQLKTIMAKEELNTSLLDHMHEPKNTMGIPESCKEAALAFAMTAGVEELNKAVKEFKTAYGNAC